MRAKIVTKTEIDQRFGLTMSAWYHPAASGREGAIEQKWRTPSTAPSAELLRT
jgi:hypothetical protein